jgi:hypothetical protein
MVMTERQQRIHWFFAHLADALLLVLVVVLIAYVFSQAT